MYAFVLKGALKTHFDFVERSWHWHIFIYYTYFFIYIYALYANAISDECVEFYNSSFFHTILRASRRVSSFPFWFQLRLFCSLNIRTYCYCCKYLFFYISISTRIALINCKQVSQQWNALVRKMFVNTFLSNPH